MNVLVTGAGGQLGRTFAKMAECADFNAIYTDVAELDITDPGAVMDMVSGMKADVILNFAAYTDVPGAERNEEAAELVNTYAPANLARAAKAVGAVLVHISTDYVYDGHRSSPYSEDTPAYPLNVYGRTKFAGDMAIVDSGCRYIILRTSWLYSEYGRNFVRTIYEKSSSVPVLDVVCDQIGSPTYAGDLADFIIGIIENGKLDFTGIYNFSDEGVCSWYDLAREICEISGNLCEVRPCTTEDYPSDVERPLYSVLDKSKVKNTFGVDIPYWKDSLVYCLSRF